MQDSQRTHWRFYILTETEDRAMNLNSKKMEGKAGRSRYGTLARPNPIQGFGVLGSLLCRSLQSQKFTLRVITSVFAASLAVRVCRPWRLGCSRSEAMKHPDVHLECVQHRDL